MANSVDPDQTAVWSGPALFAQTCLSQYLSFYGISTIQIVNIHVALNLIIFKCGQTHIFECYRQTQSPYVDKPCSINNV